MHCPSCYRPISDTDRNCPSCGISLSVWNPPASNPAARRARLDEERTFGGFWKRFAAYLIDSLILFVGSVILAVPLVLLLGTDEASIERYELPLNLLSIVVGWLYFAIMESSERQATFGKQVLGIRVTDLDGERISFARASGRHFAKILSFLTLLIGFIMAGFTARKQGLHDMIAGTVVVNEPGSGSKLGCIIVSVVVVLGGVVLAGILAAVAIPAYQDYVRKAKAMQEQEEGALPADDAAGDVQAPDAGSGTTDVVAAHGDAVARAIGSHARAHGEMPAALSDVADMPVDDGSGPLVSYSPEISEITIASRDGSLILVMTGMSGNNGNIVWSCRGLKPGDYPPSCAAW